MNDRKSSPNKHPHNPKNRNQIDNHFCQYQNGVYMGGMNAFQKNGTGILLLDDESCAITTYSHNVMSGHNIILRNGNSLTSMIIPPSSRN